MDPRTQERVEQWDSRPFSGGFDDLSTLADSDFSGAVAAGGAWLFMLNGRVVGTVDGEITDFEDASGTVYRAPDPSLPLLSVMEERGGNVQAQYYTNETPLREVDQTLQDGSFTGYIELSENVLSGDYYAVYYGGRRMAAAYIGNAERLLTGDEAFERADDEVGIYKVFNVDIDVTDIPGTSATAGTQADTADTGPGADASDSTGVDTGTGNTTDASDSTTDSTTRAEPSVDPTESAIDQLDVSGTGGRTGTETGAGTNAGPETNTTADEETDQTLPTDLTPGSESDTGTSTSTGTDTDAESHSEPQSTPESGITTDDSSSIVDDESDGPAGITAPTESETDESTEQTETVVGSTTGADTSETPADGSQSGLSSTPDPETVEAAAEELDQSDISWIEDDADEADTAGTPAPPAPDHAGAGPESVTAANDSAERDTDSDTDAGAGADTDTDAGKGEGEGETEGEEEGELDQQLEAEEAWRETRSIPSIDPDNSAAGDSSRAAPSRAANGRSRSGSQSRAQSEAGSDSGASAGTAGSSSSSGSGSSSSPDSQSTSTTDSHNGQAAQSSTAPSRSQPASDQRNREQSADANRNAPTNGDDAHKRNLAQYTQRIEELEQKHNALAEKARELKSERDELRAENQQLTSTVDSLRTQISELESELEQARAGSAQSGSGSGSGSSFDAETQLSPTEALSGTNLFVRYDSKSQPTLETAHDGAADRNEVASNLRLEHHTEFEADSVAVDGQPYETHLQETIEYTFVDWLTEMVLYEIRDTGNADGLADLYDAIPRIDRAELGATISLADDDTEDVPDEVTFDVVAFDKMGNPLILATLNDSREPASQELLEELEVAASAVKANYPDLAAAVAVTSSYFEPGALEVTEEATSSGFLSRGSKLSYVNLSRKSGYHLCLVESRSEGFHMNVPEL
ncbi:hypothetical protein C483_17313 [Natrialba hulunbeirensis JCM 10989]|uniref:DUF7527 domain-containing protein n=1 Tax=Natrialba hulunbeirensis JCM 10989 TaxID=1227493 RepID=L9ZMD4_9EURY|nr:hypothetical protein [Natrialba hulunbeirensis]ELY87680.1 hypothetical protein C483_17313 [Natrialba hulunbeirensis JCM 10989]